MSRKFTATLATALALGAMALIAEAQQHRATRLGNPATRFAKPLKKPDELRVLLRSEKMKADVAAVLADIGWQGDQADLDRAAASAEIQSIQVQPNTRMPFMAARKKGRPTPCATCSGPARSRSTRTASSSPRSASATSS